jgi:V8-like Glu-specific endopeptidase
MKLSRLSALLLVLNAISASALFAGTRAIYGADDRLDYYAASPEWRKPADSTAALFPAGSVKPDGTLFLFNHGQVDYLCPGERFANQPKGPSCTGSLVAPDIIMTAGHCFSTPACVDKWNEAECAPISVEKCAKTKFVFGYAIKTADVMPTSVPPEEVYDCGGIIAMKLDDTHDFAFVRLNKPVANHSPLQLNRGAGIAAGSSVVTIGYPNGTPEKVTGGAKVRNVSDPEFFVTDLDAFKGNSGGPVFNAATHLVEGIVVSGEKNFVQVGDCMVAKVFPQNEGIGTFIQKISVMLPFLHESAAASLKSAQPETISAKVAPVTLETGEAIRAGKTLESLSGGR